MSEHGAPPPPPEDPRDAPVVIPGGNRGWGPPPPGWATPPAGIHPAAPDATGGTPAGPVPSDGPGAGKPGVAPLRPLRFADLLDATFATVRRAPLPTVAQAVVVQLVPALLSLFLAYRLDASIVALESTLGRLAAAPDPAGWGPILSSGLLVHPWQSYAWAGTALLAVQLMANALIAGPSTVAGMRAVLGMGTGWGAALALCAGPMVRMLLWNLCLLVAAVLLLGLLAAGALLVAAALGALAAVALSLATGLVLLPLLLWVGIRLCLVPTLLVTRKAGIGGAVRESWKLSAGSWWRILGIMLVVSVVLGMLGGLATQLASFIGGELVAAGAPLDAGLAVAIVANALIAALGMVLTQLMLVMLQLDLRIRRERLDLVLAAEARDPHAHPLPGSGAPGT